MTVAPNSPIETASNAARALQIIESMPGHAWSADPAGKLTYLSPSALAFLGNAPEDFHVSEAGDGLGQCGVIHPEDYDRVAARWRHCLETGDHYDTEYRLRRADGVYRWFRNSGRPSRNSKGHITQWYGTAIDIEDQKLAEAALRERERELSQLVDLVPGYLWRLSPDGEPTFFNKRLIDFLGLDLAEADKSDPSRLAALIEAAVHPDDAESLGAAFNRSFVTGERFSKKYRLRRADGAYHWVEGSAEPLRDGSGRIVQWYGLSLDINDQTRAEGAPRQSELQLQQLIDTVPVQIWSVTPTDESAYINKTMVDYTGLKLEASDAQTGMLNAIQTIAHPDDRAALLQAITHSFSTGESFELKFRTRRWDGLYRWTAGHAEPLREESGRIIRWYGVNVDIHDFVTAQESLRDRERSLWQLVETLPVMIDCSAPNGEPIYRSRQLREFLGYELEELDGTGKGRLAGTLDASVHPDDLEGVKERYAHSLATGEPYARKHRLRRFDGDYRWVDTRAAPMRDDEGAILQWNVTCLDIDREVRAQEELQLARESLARASQAASLAELSAAIAHEVNQPLAAIVSHSNACRLWLSAAPPNLERAQKAVERIIRDANSAADVVSRIRALFKRSTEARTRVTLGSVIGDAHHLMAEEAARRRVRMNIEVEDDLPPVTLDRVQVQQVLVNLIRNGLEAMDSTADDGVLGIHVRRVGDMVQIEINDRGRGVEFPERIFEPFFTTKVLGMGMGLAICRSIVVSHGGRLWCEKNEPKGARFIFTLPAEVRTTT